MILIECAECRGSGWCEAKDWPCTKCDGRGATPRPRFADALRGAIGELIELWRGRWRR